eukprot:5247176-Prymnesium_polylepis.1
MKPSRGNVLAMAAAARRRWPSRALLLLGAASCAAQHSVVHDDAALDALHKGNAFFARKTLNASQLEEMLFGIDGAEAETSSSKACSIDVQLAWTTRLGSSVYSTPHIAASPHGGRQVWASTFVRFVEALRGDDGHELAGWPFAFGHSSIHASPLLYDADGDGIDEVIVVTFDAEVVVLRQDGLPIPGTGLKLPKLKVPKRWYEGLKAV